MLIAKNAKLLFIGDSITDAGRNKPVGEGKNQAWGSGYVNVIGGLLGARYPERRIRLVNMGVSGNTARDLAERWQRDVLELEPDWLSVMIGINDVWRQFDSPLRPEIHVDLGEYRETLDELLREVRRDLDGLVLMSPYFLEPNRQDPMRAMMDRYGEACRELADAHDAVFVDVQAAFDRVLEHRHPMSLAWDRVHPEIEGHSVIARSFLQAVDFEF
jgi:lysophospholipase L1-like esterase